MKLVASDDVFGVNDEFAVCMSRLGIGWDTLLFLAFL